MDTDVDQSTMAVLLETFDVNNFAFVDTFRYSEAIFNWPGRIARFSLSFRSESDCRVLLCCLDEKSIWRPGQCRLSHPASSGYLLKGLHN